MQSPFRVRNWIIFLLINVLVSATTAFIVVRAFTQAAGRPAVTRAEGAIAATSAGLAPNAASAAEAGGISPTGVSPTGAPAESAGQRPTAGEAAPAQGTLPLPTALPAARPASSAGTPKVRISTVVYPGQRTREAVVIVNEGDEVALTGWTLSNPRGKVYTFGNVALFKESFINLHTTTGVDVPTDLFWNQTEAVWREGDEVTLRRGDEVIATYIVR
jgi:hypothetical protein